METVRGCPKFLRNGPCGGYKNGCCEVYPDQKCLFVSVWEKNPTALTREV